MKKFENFSKALDNLKNIHEYNPPLGTVELTGLVALYEICFEQAWKAMKELLETSGYVEYRSGSPKQVLKAAYEAGLISNEELWISALADRNNAAHSYNELIAYDIIKNTKEKYYPLFNELKQEIERDWL